jgi:hypothetical protein
MVGLMGFEPSTLWAAVRGVSQYRASARAHALQPLGPPEGQPGSGGPKKAVIFWLENSFKMFLKFCIGNPI